jgi:hypothetical protein
LTNLAISGTRRALRDRDRFRCVLLSSLLSWSMGSPARADDTATAVVWYRASAECPQGAEFLGKLGERARLARLAAAGDHVDFVVTLQGADRETVGRVERQTASGTVAIRELRDASCARVAEALALSLALSLQPKGEQPTQGNSASPPEAAPETPAVTPAVAASEALTPTPVAAAIPLHAAAEPMMPPQLKPTAQRDVAPSPKSPNERGTPKGGWFALQLGALTGVAPSVLIRGAASVAVEDVLPTLLRGASVRFAPVFAYGSAETRVGTIEHWVLSGRAEGCPLRWGSADFGVAPCLGIEAGVTHAAASDAADSGQANLWLSAGAGLRAALAIASGTKLEVQAEAQTPLFRNDVTAGVDRVYRQKIIGFQGGLGVSAELW